MDALGCQQKRALGAGDEGGPILQWAMVMQHRYVSVSKRSGRIGITCTNLPEGNGVRITGLLRDSVGAAAGLNVGDIIVSVNGVLVHAHQTAIREIDSSPDMVVRAVS